MNKLICIKDIPDFHIEGDIKYKTGTLFELNDKNIIINHPNIPYFIVNMIVHRNNILNGCKKRNDIYEEVVMNLENYLVNIGKYREIQINSILD